MHKGRLDFDSLNAESDSLYSRVKIINWFFVIFKLNLLSFQLKLSNYIRFYIKIHNNWDILFYNVIDSIIDNSFKIV